MRESESQSAYRLPRCLATPVADHQVSFVLDGKERLRWHHGPQYPRPFLYPLIGPAGACLTRMGHPGAPDHDHHRSVWFAHNKVLGIDFWSDQSTARIRQTGWLCYKDGEHEALMAVRLGWFDGHDPKELLAQELVIAASHLNDGEMSVEIQSTFSPIADELELGQTNFGFLAVRVAKSISAAFGGGCLTNSHGAKGEKGTFGKRAAWMDYSGPVAPDVVEGVAILDHPENPGYPTHWHVRDDGWMGASACFSGPISLRKGRPLRLRYLLYVHSGNGNADTINAVAARFAASKAISLVKSSAPHHAFDLVR